MYVAMYIHIGIKYVATVTLSVYSCLLVCTYVGHVLLHV